MLSDSLSLLPLHSNSLILYPLGVLVHKLWGSGPCERKEYLPLLIFQQKDPDIYHDSH